MKPPDFLLPMTAGEDPETGDLQMYDSFGEKIARYVIPNHGKFIAFCCNTHEATQAELETLRTQLRDEVNMTRHLKQEIATIKQEVEEAIFHIDTGETGKALARIEKIFDKCGGEG